MDTKVFHVIARPPEQFEPFEKHVAESKWQFCKCETCQRKRKFLDSLPGDRIDYATFRLKDEKY